MVDSAITRTARAMDIIPFVLENPGIKISDLAAKFYVSEKQVIKDLELIFMCGLPGYTPYELIDLTFDDGAVTIIDPQLFDKPRKFSETEAVIITLGLQVLRSSVSSVQQIATIDSLIIKLVNKFKVVSNTKVETPIKPVHYDKISKAINDKESISIEYISSSSDKVSKRNIKPHRITLRNGFYYLFAEDQKLLADRVYRVDQIISVDSVQEGGSDQSYVEKENQENEFLLKISDQLTTEKYREIFTEVSKSGNHYLVKGRSSNAQWLQRWILSKSSVVDVIEPKTLQDTIKVRAQSALDLYLP